jgi:hypothetical protein
MMALSDREEKDVERGRIWRLHPSMLLSRLPSDAVIPIPGGSGFLVEEEGTG